MRGTRDTRTPDPQATNRLAAKLRARGAGDGSNLLGHLQNACAEAVRVLDLARDDGYFDDCTTHEAVRVAALDILTDQYPNLDVEVRTDQRTSISMAYRFPGETNEDLRRRLRTHTMRFRVYNRGHQ